MSEEPDNKRKSLFRSHPILTAGAIVVIAIGTTWGTLKAYKPIKSWVKYGAIAKQTGRTVDEVAKYPSLIGHTPFLSYIVGDIPLPALEVLVKDSEIIERATKNLEKNPNKYGLKYEMRNVMLGLTTGGFGYNHKGRIMDRDDAIGHHSVISDLNLEDYLILHEQKGLGFFTGLAAQHYGLTKKNLLDIEIKLNEDDISRLQTAKVPVPYSLQRLLQGKKSEDIVKDYVIERAATSYDVSLDDLLKIPEPNENDFLLLKKEDIPVKYGVPGLQEGKKAGEIIEKYSMEMTGVSAEVRREYRAIPMPYWHKLIDEEIKDLAASGMIPEYFEEIAREDIARKDLWLIETAFKLIRQGKLNGEIYKKWRSEGISEFSVVDTLLSVDDTLFAIEHGYSPVEAINALLNSGKSLREFDRDVRYHRFLDAFPKQPMLNPAPK